MADIAQAGFSGDDLRPKSNGKFGSENRCCAIKKGKSYSNHPSSSAFAASFREGRHDDDDDDDDDDHDHDHCHDHDHDHER